MLASTTNVMFEFFAGGISAGIVQDKQKGEPFCRQGKHDFTLAKSNSFWIFLNRALVFWSLDYTLKIA